MADRGILFSAPMVRALLEGRKTQTRRGLSIKGHKSFSQFGRSDTLGYDWHFRDTEALWHDLRHKELLARLRWQIGDRLWVKETWQIAGLYSDVAEVRYRASERDGHTKFVEQVPIERVTRRVVDFPKWRPSIFMPRWASRLTLTVTDVRVERLQDISEADAKAEGIVEYEPTMEEPAEFAAFDGAMTFNNAVSAYYHLWIGINGTGSWAENPWIVAVSFDVRMGNIDTLQNAEFPA